jgi:hypothetical protein
MVSQFEALQNIYSKKIGFKELKAENLLKYLIDNSPIPGVFIPINSFKSYA